MPENDGENIVLGMRGSFFKSVVLNPLVWLGLGLTGFTLHYEGYQHAFEVFLWPKTYGYVALASIIYVALFDRQYKRGGRRIDISETIGTVLEGMLVILMVWGLSLFFCVHYHLGGMSYSAELRERYKKAGWIKNDNAAEDYEAVKELTSGVLEDGSVEMEAGKKYKVTPQPDGSMVIEVLE